MAISVKLPLQKDGKTGKYASNETYLDMVKQNFKNLILTIPGERAMLPDFGVGLFELLFSQGNTSILRDDIAARVQEQVSTYMPYLEITNIIFSSSEEKAQTDPNSISMRIEYKILPLSLIDFLEITV